MTRAGNDLRQWMVWALVCCIVLWSSYRFLVAPPPGLVTAASYAAYPVLWVQRSCIQPIASWRAHNKAVDDLQNELSQSRMDYGQLLAENISLSAQVAFAQDTKELRDFKARYAPEKMQLAQILARHFSQDSHYFYLDMGTNVGIETDMIVIHNNCLVGKVTDVYPWYCRAVLITDKSCKVAAYCEATKARGIHEGLNQERNAMLKFVSHLAPIQIGDMVLSSGEGLVFPRGFALGKVKSSSLDGLYQQVEIESLVDFEKIDYCLILSKDVHDHVSLVPELPAESLLTTVATEGPVADVAAVQDTNQKIPAA